MAADGLFQAVLFSLNRPEPIRQAGLLMLLAVNLSDERQLIAALEGTAGASNTPWSKKVLQFRDLIQQGISPATAAFRVDGLLPEETVVALHLAEHSGTLPEVLSEEATRLLGQTDRSSAGRVIQSVVSFLGVMIVLLTVTTFVGVFIIPKYLDVLEELRVDIPTPTRWLSDILSVDFLTMSVVITPLFFTAVTLAVLGIRIVTEQTMRGHSRLLMWRPRFGTPFVLRVLSLATASGTALPDALHRILTVMQPCAVATALSSVRTSVENGVPLIPALKSGRFLNRREFRFLTAAETAGHLDWGLKHLAANIQQRREGRLEMAANAFGPIACVVSGILVGLFAIALYLPLIELIRNVQVD